MAALVHAGKQKLSQGEASDTESQRASPFLELLLQRLVRGNARRELNNNGITCVSDEHSDICITHNSVRIATTSTGITVHLTAGQRLPASIHNPFTLHPYPRKTDPIAISRTSPVTILSNPRTPPPCSTHHSSPAVLFSAGGFAGNFFHDINDVLIPLFLTTSFLRPQLHLLIADLQSYWFQKYQSILRRFSTFDPITPSHLKVLCFPAAIVGLKYHGNLLCNSSESPVGVSTADFRHFLHLSYSLPHLHRVAPKTKEPVLVLISRRKSRMLLNEGGVVRVAEEAGFEVVVATPEMVGKVQEFSVLVNRCGVLVGVHGAGMTNLVFLPPGGVVVQIVPWGLDWAAGAYYGRPARGLGLQYVEYQIKAEESTLYEEYQKDDPVIADPWSVNRRGYNVSGPVYTDRQNLRIDLARFRKTILEARRLL